jgi:hypothetical protein
MSVRTVIDGIRQPEYTGENRCVPCTVANLVITAVLAAGIGLISVPLAAVFVAAALGSIWLRGYLVPKTPELTKRYFPDWLLAKFDKEPMPGDENAGMTAPETFDPEPALLDAGVVEPCAEVEDLCLTDRFDRVWRDRIDAFDDDEESLRLELADQLELDPETVNFESYGDAYVAGRKNDRPIGQWESRAALVADLAGAQVLPEWIDGWDRLGPRQRSQLLGGLRVFVEECPTCGGTVAPGTDTVESCCRETTVVDFTCEACGDRLLEVPHEEAVA